MDFLAIDQDNFSQDIILNKNVSQDTKQGAVRRTAMKIGVTTQEVVKDRVVEVRDEGYKTVTASKRIVAPSNLVFIDPMTLGSENSKYNRDHPVKLYSDAAKTRPRQWRTGDYNEDKALRVNRHALTPNISVADFLAYRRIKDRKRKNKVKIDLRPDIDRISELHFLPQSLTYTHAGLVPMPTSYKPQTFVSDIIIQSIRDKAAAPIALEVLTALARVGSTAYCSWTTAWAALDGSTSWVGAVGSLIAAMTNLYNIFDICHVSCPSSMDLSNQLSSVVQFLSSLASDFRCQLSHLASFLRENGLASLATYSFKDPIDRLLEAHTAESQFAMWNALLSEFGYDNLRAHIRKRYNDCPTWGDIDIAVKRLWSAVSEPTAQKYQDIANTVRILTILNYVPQANYKEMYASSELKNIIDKVVNFAAISSIVGLFFPASVVSEALVNLKKIFQGVDVMNLLQAAGDGLCTIFRRIYDWIVGNDPELTLMSALFTPNSRAIFTNRYMSFVTESMIFSEDYCGKILRQANLHHKHELPVAWAKEYNILKEICAKLTMEASRIQPAEVIVLTRINSDILTAYKRGLSKIGSFVRRVTPFVITNFGVSGVGKSTWTEKFVAICKHSYNGLNDFSAQDVYTRNSGDGFWSGYDGAFATVFDDIGAIFPDCLSTPSQEITDLIQSVNTVPYHLNMAAVEDKGTTFTSPLVLITTNNLELFAPKIRKMPEAVYRRLGLCIEWRPTSPFRKDGDAGLADFDKIRQQALDLGPDGLPAVDIAEVRLSYASANPVNTQLVHNYTTPYGSSWISLREMFAFVSKQSKIHYDRENSLVSGVMQRSHFVTCNTCGSAYCSCLRPQSFSTILIGSFTVFGVIGLYMFALWIEGFYLRMKLEAEGLSAALASSAFDSVVSRAQVAYEAKIESAQAKLTKLGKVLLPSIGIVATAIFMYRKSTLQILNAQGAIAPAEAIHRQNQLSGMIKKHVETEYAIPPSEMGKKTPAKTVQIHKVFRPMTQLDLVKTQVSSASYFMTVFPLLAGEAPVITSQCMRIGTGVVCNFHVFKEYQNRTFCIWIHRSPVLDKKDGVSFECGSMQMKHIRNYPGTDFASFNIDNTAIVSQKWKHLLMHPDLEEHLLDCDFEICVGGTWHSLPMGVRKFDPRKFKYFHVEGIEYPTSLAVDGTCGSPVIAIKTIPNSSGEPQVIVTLVGLHVAGDPGKMGVAAFLTRPILDYLTDSTTVIEASEVLRHTRIYPMMHLRPYDCLPDGEIPDTIIPLGKANVVLGEKEFSLGRSPAPTSLIPTKIREAVIAKEPEGQYIGDKRAADMVPGPLAPFFNAEGEYRDSRVVDMNNISHTSGVWHYEVADAAATIFEKQYRKLAPRLYERLGIYSLSEAISRLNMNTAVGPPFQGPKANYFMPTTMLDQDPHHLIASEAMLAEVETVFTKIRDGDFSGVLFSNNQKDELISRKKANLGEVRNFCGGPTSILLLSNMFLGPRLDELKEKRIDLPSCVGVNCFDGVEVSKLFRALNENHKPGKWAMMDSDIRKYDKTNRFAYRVLLHIFGPMYAREEPSIWAFVKNLLFALTHYLMIAGDVLYFVQGIFPSGILGTAELNCIMLVFFFIMAYLLCFRDHQMEQGEYIEPFDYGSVPDFWDNVVLFVYGDDNIEKIHESVLEWFNGETIVQSFHELGFEVTDSQKTGPPRPMSIREITFLKRRFWYDSEKSVERMVLDANSSLKSLCYYSKQSAMTEPEIMLSTVRSCMLEWAQNGREVYESMRSWILPILVDTYPRMAEVFKNTVTDYDTTLATLSADVVYKF